MAKKKKTPETQPEVTELNVIDHQTSYCIEEGDDEQWGRRDCMSTSHDIRGLRIVRNYGDVIFPGIVKNGDQLYLLYAIYSTGDSFGFDEGSITFIDVFKSKEKADAAYAAVAKGKKVESPYGGSPSDGYEYLNEAGTLVKCGFAPWAGYFERLSSLNLESFVVTDDKPLDDGVWKDSIWRR